MDFLFNFAVLKAVAFFSAGVYARPYLAKWYVSARNKFADWASR